MTSFKSITMLLVALSISAGFIQFSVAQDQNIPKPDIIVGVDGLACPFCAYGIEKKLLKIDAVQKLFVDIENGTIELKLKEKAVLSEEDIRKAIKKAGFEVRDIRYVNKAAKPNTKTDA